MQSVVWNEKILRTVLDNDDRFAIYTYPKHVLAEITVNDTVSDVYQSKHS